MQAGKGDCEDIAIAKYFKLKKSGMADERLWLLFAKVYLGDKKSNIWLQHMVVGYYPANRQDPYILDSIIDTVYPASERQDIEILFRFNQREIIIKQQHYPISRLPKWHHLLQRLKG